MVLLCFRLLFAWSKLGKLHAEPGDSSLGGTTLSACCFVEQEPDRLSAAKLATGGDPPPRLFFSGKITCAFRSAAGSNAENMLLPCRRSCETSPQLI